MKDIQKGFSLIEVIITMVILGILFPGVVYISSNALDQYRSLSVENKLASKSRFAIRKLSEHLNRSKKFLSADNKEIRFQADGEVIAYEISGGKLHLRIDSNPSSVLVDGVDETLIGGQSRSRFIYYTSMTEPLTPEAVPVDIVELVNIVCVKLVFTLILGEVSRNYSMLIHPDEL